MTTTSALPIIPLCFVLSVLCAAVFAGPSSRHEQPSLWSGEHVAPSFCHKLKAETKLLPRATRCYRNKETGMCRDGTTRFLSEFEQDQYLYINHFSHMSRRGVYVDLAANHPFSISNTYFMDRCLGWQGLCIEANHQYYNLLSLHRSCAIVPNCISDKEGEEVEFYLSGPASGIGETNVRGRPWKHVLNDTLTDSGSSTRMKCTTLANVLEKRGVSVIDYLSLDIEGDELKALQSVDWNAMKVNVMTVEMNKNFADLEDFLLSKGYKRHVVTLEDMKLMTDESRFLGPDRKVGGLFNDAIFLHNSVTFGKPE